MLPVAVLLPVSRAGVFHPHNEGVESHVDTKVSRLDGCVATILYSPLPEKFYIGGHPQSVF